MISPLSHKAKGGTRGIISGGETDGATDSKPSSCCNPPVPECACGDGGMGAPCCTTPTVAGGDGGMSASDEGVPCCTAPAVDGGGGGMGKSAIDAPEPALAGGDGGI
eukprot:scaffold272914_cov15-Tisochrysis_lutea.AAC.1